jgi:3-dehydroquinate synthase
MQVRDQDSPVLQGLQEFREHLGGRLTIMLLTDIGAGKEVNEINTDLVIRAAKELSRYNIQDPVRNE